MTYVRVSNDEVRSLCPFPDLLQDDDPIIEYEDEFGRVRTGRRSEVPRHLLEPEEPAEEDIEYVTKASLLC